MRGLATAGGAIALAAVAAGCSAKDDGLVIVFADADTAAAGRDVVALELFVGVTGSDPRFVRDYDPARDQFAVAMAELPGYRLFLRADVVPADLEAVAIVGYDGDPAAGGQPLVFGVIDDPPFADGELHEVTMTFAPVVDRGNAGPSERWIDRWGAAPIEAVAAYACLQWGLGQGAVDGQIVRTDDLDCDGTVPPTCDPMQTDRLLLESDADVDGDGYGAWATTDCAACLIQDDEDGPLRAVACDCNEQDAAIHFAADELCDGVDTDCDGAFDGNYAGQFSIPCQVQNAISGDCSMGVHACTETAGAVDDASCAPLPASHVACVDLSGCRTPRDCPAAGAGSPATLAIYHCAQKVFQVGPEYCGTAPVAQFFPSLGMATPSRCGATLWTDEATAGGWQVALVDAAGNHGRSFTDVACDQLAIAVETAPAANGSHTFFVLTIADGAGTPIAVVPIDLGTVLGDGACDVNDATVCTPPPST